MVSVRKNYLYNIIYQILLLLLPLVTVPYLTRTLGAFGLGMFAYTNSIAQYFVIMIMMGVNLYGSRQIAKVRDDVNKLGKEFSEIISLQIINAVIFIIIYLIYALYVYLFEYDRFPITIVWSAYVLSAGFDITWFFAGLENFKIIVVRNVVLKFAMVIGIFIFVTDDSSLLTYVLLVSVGTFFSQVALWFNNCVQFKFDCRLKTYKKHFRRCFTLFIPVISVSIYTIVDKVMLGYMSTYDQLAFFDNSQKIITIPLALITSLGNVMLPRITHLLVGGNDDMIDGYIEKTMFFTIVASIGFVSLIVAIAPVFSRLFFGDSFADCGDMIKYLSLTIPFIAWANVIRMQYLIPRNMDYAYVIAVVLGALINLLMNFILIPKYNAYGAIFATIATEIFVAIIQTAYVKNKLPIARFFYNGMFFIIPGVVSCYGMIIAIGYLNNNMISIAVNAFLGGGVYLLGVVCIIKKRSKNMFNI